VTDRDNDADDGIGYGRPPKHTRFRPGQSGNPKGRPSGVHNIATDILEEMREQIIVTEGGRTRRMSKQKAMVKSLLAKALKGDVRAVIVLLKKLDDIEHAARGRTDPDELSRNDQDILNDFRRQLLEELQIKPARRNGP
jgi:hypothetical protein